MKGDSLFPELPSLVVGNCDSFWLHFSNPLFLICFSSQSHKLQSTERASCARRGQWRSSQGGSDFIIASQGTERASRSGSRSRRCEQYLRHSQRKWDWGGEQNSSSRFGGRWGLEHDWENGRNRVERSIRNWSQATWSTWVVKKTT